MGEKLLMKTDIVLLPCPFCGAIPDVDKSYAYISITIGCLNKACAVKPFVSEAVDVKESQPLFERHEGSIAAKWNHRT